MHALVSMVSLGMTAIGLYRQDRSSQMRMLALMADH
jgi:hypothetical protein